MNCSYCGAELKKNHILEFQEGVVMENGDKIISPCCSVCKHTICSQEVSAGINGGQKVILLSGPCGAGKSSIGRYISQKYGYIHIDGDSVSKRVNWEIRNHRIKDRSGYLVHQEVIETMEVVLGLGYSVIVTYIIEREVLEDYLLPLKKSGLQPVFRILLPERKVCINRDISRKGWTAGPEFIDKWYEQQVWLGAKMPGSIIDSSNESLEETVDRHFPILI